MKEAPHWRARHPDWIITSSAHSLRALMAAQALDAVFLSPVFATTSHPGHKPLTPVRAAFIAAPARVPVYALGGVTAAQCRAAGAGFQRHRRDQLTPLTSSNSRAGKTHPA